MLHFGILAGQDKVLEAGDNFTDPFNALDVKDICIDREFAVLFNDIDYDKLIDYTANFNYVEWEQYMRYNYFMLYTQKDQEIITRFAWWLCHQVLYEQRNQKFIDLTNILYENSPHNQLRLYIYNSNAMFDYNIAATLSTGSQILILFKNKTNT